MTCLVHSLQHVPFEGLGAIEPYLRKKGHRLQRTRLYMDEEFPLLSEIDWLIVMGGPMGVYDDIQYPWLQTEREFIRAAAKSGKIVLGICLGAQLIAAALGAKVMRNKYREIGWFPIRRTAQARQSRLGRVLPDVLEVFHWHGDTFDNPPGSTPLATSRACSNQGFVIEDRIVGLQFHLETTPESAKSLIENCRHELDGSRFAQTEEEILSDPARFREVNTVLQSVLGVLAQEAKK